ncbi:MarC family protein [Capnocytophaga sp.]|uniref:MarC family protein n=1 Tax=Capnocytophaga sp. TaxID=44737 RepID=UPI0026DC3EEB|nr:MarC family protein [Capnocytophaga sp.]MDO5104908.1 MarC family protein [Capnocytophaga sp.]
MSFDIEEITTITLALFVAIDIIGSIPIITKLREKSGYIQSEKTVIVSGILFFSFLFFGEKILGLVSVTVPSFAVAGAFILFFFALEMILGIELYKDEAPQTASIVPLAFPLVAGATSLAILINSREKYALENIVVGILINLLIVYVVLKNSEKLEKRLGKQGISVLRKIFGVILLAIAVEMFITNAKAIFHMPVVQ